MPQRLNNQKQSAHLPQSHHAPPKTDDIEHFAANPTGKANNGLSIYELAAMQADPDSLPNNTEVQDDGERIECSICGRKFNSNAIAKHEGICQKVFQQKRKVFDTKEQRKADGLDLVQTSSYGAKPPARKGMAKAPAKPAPNNSKPTAGLPKWKLQSLQFRQAMMNANGGSGGGSNFNPS